MSTGVQLGIPMPSFTTALSFYDGYRHAMLPANLLQVKPLLQICSYCYTDHSTYMTKAPSLTQKPDHADKLAVTLMRSPLPLTCRLVNSCYVFFFFF